jgi:hypothetical protein
MGGGVAPFGINFGVLLAGHGTVWSDDYEFGVVDDSVPVTGDEVTIQEDRLKRLKKEPVNLDFEER